MVHIYTDKNLTEKPVIDKNKSYFALKVGIAGIKENGIECIRKVDNAELIEGTDMVLTPFGKTQVENMSTGCLTLLNLLYVKDNSLDFGVDVTGCGANALDLAFEIADGTGIPLVLRYLGVSKCKNREFMVNGKNEVDDVFDLAVLLEKHLKKEAV